jgi:antitoxin (DNA-binding transcriptional repressor) of toxin-antitoxin stability system
MSTMTIEEAQAKLSEVIDKLAPGEEVIITRNEQARSQIGGPAATHTQATSARECQRQAGDSRRGR